MGHRRKSYGSTAIGDSGRGGVTVIGNVVVSFGNVNHIKTKSRLFNLKTMFEPSSKHISSLL